MTDYFFDSSALIKRYAREPGFTWVLSITEPPSPHTILLTEISLAEVAAAIAAKQRAPQGMSVTARNRAVGRFLLECDSRFTLVPANRRVIDLAVSLTQRYRLRGYDAVQLAAALTANQDLMASGHATLVLVTADADLLTAAHGETLLADDPLNYMHLDPSP